MKNSKYFTYILSLLQTVKCLVVNRWMNTRLPETFEKKETSLSIERASPQTTRTEIPKIVWVYWHEENMPFFIKKIVESNTRLIKDFEVRLLNRNTVRKYLPDLGVFHPDLEVVHISDVIRLKLLTTYGGVWMDATVMLGDSLEWVSELSKLKKYDLIGYYREKNTIDFEYPIIETWFMASYPESEFLKRWLAVFEPISILGPERYFESLKARSDYNVNKQKISTPSYLMLNIAEQIVSRSLTTLSIYLKRSEDSAFYIQEFYGWNNYKINYAVCRLENLLPILPVIKLTSGDRMFITRFNQFGWIRRNSTMGIVQNKIEETA